MTILTSVFTATPTLAEEPKLTTLEQPKRSVVYGAWKHMAPFTLFGILWSKAYATRTIDLMEDGKSIYSCVDTGDIELDDDGNSKNGRISPKRLERVDLKGEPCPFFNEENGYLVENLDIKISN